MPSEFALIRKHFTRPARHTDLAVGDDAALIRPSAGMQLAISTDMLWPAPISLPTPTPKTSAGKP